MIHQFGVMPLSQATADLFKVRYEVIMVNSIVRPGIRSVVDHAHTLANGLEPMDAANQLSGFPTKHTTHDNLQ